MSAHSASQRGGWLSALVAQVSDYVFEEVEERVEQPQELVAHPVVAVVAAAPRSGTTTVARLLAAEFASRGDGSALVLGSARSRRGSPPSRAAARLVTALRGALEVQPLGRICIAASSDRAAEVSAARYLAPVVLDVPADGSAAGVAAVADRIAVVSAATGEPALLDAVATVIGGESLKVVNRVTDAGEWDGRADVQLPESRLAARAAGMGTRALGPLGSAIAALADALEASR
jgi:hypothetical protein